MNTETYQIQLNTETVEVTARPSLEECCFLIETVIYKGIDVWPILSECEQMVELIEKKIEAKNPEFIEAVRRDSYLQQDTAMFKYGR